MKKVLFLMSALMAFNVSADRLNGPLYTDHLESDMPSACRACMNQAIAENCSTDQGRNLAVVGEQVMEGSQTVRCETRYKSTQADSEDTTGYVYVRLEEFAGEMDCSLVGLSCR